MARKYTRDNAGRFASVSGGGRAGSSGAGKRAPNTAPAKGGSAAGKAKPASQGSATAKTPISAAGTKKRVYAPPPPAWSKEMLAAKAKADRADKARAAAKSAAAKPVRAKDKPKTKPPANTIKPSSLLAAEKAYGEIKAQKSKFRSDKKVREEMIRRGFLKGSDPQGKLIEIARKYRMRRGGTY